MLQVIRIEDLDTDAIEKMDGDAMEKLQVENTLAFSLLPKKHFMEMEPKFVSTVTRIRCAHGQACFSFFFVVVVALQVLVGREISASVCAQTRHA